MQVQHRRLARAGLADQRDLLAAAARRGRRRRARPGRPRGPGARASQPQLVARTAPSSTAPGRSVMSGARVEHLEGPADADDGVLERPEHEHDLVHQLVDRLHVGDEDPQRARRSPRRRSPAATPPTARPPVAIAGDAHGGDVQRLLGPPEPELGADEAHADRLEPRRARRPRRRTPARRGSRPSSARCATVSSPMCCAARLRRGLDAAGQQPDGDGQRRHDEQGDEREQRIEDRHEHRHQHDPERERRPTCRSRRSSPPGSRGRR